MTLLTSWLLTYLLHSTLLLGAAALLCLALGRRRLGLQEAVLRAALVGSVVTASLQLGLGLQPLGGVFRLPEERPAPVEAEKGSDLAASIGPEAGEVEVVFGSLPSVLEKVRRGDGPTEVSRRALPVLSAWTPWLTGLWMALGFLALARMAVAATRLHHLLRSRYPLENGDLASRATALAAELGLRRPVPVSTAPRLEVPLATGVLRPEVCLPTRALEELEGDQQVALCAHELAHVARRDPSWILAARLVEAAVPVQPLATWARRRLQDIAECLSDDLAVVASGRPVGLARSLVDVAAWTVAEPVPLPAAASGALSTRSRLGHRVERLMDPLRSLERPRRYLLPVAVAVVLATALVTPVVSGQPEAEPRPLEAPDPQPAPAAPAAPAAPEAPKAPEAPEPPRSEAAQRLEELTRSIRKRVEAQQAEMAGIEAEIEAIVQESLPKHEELTRLSRELEVAAHALAEAQKARQEGSDERTRQEVEAARRQMEEARTKVREAVRAVRIPEEAMLHIREKAREIAVAARPTAEEREEMRRLARELARESRHDRSELRDEMRKMGRELEREDLVEAREAMREAGRRVREMMRESFLEIREAMRAARESAREAARQAREESRRESERERGLEEDEESHLEESSKEESKTDTP